MKLSMTFGKRLWLLALLLVLGLVLTSAFQLVITHAVGSQQAALRIVMVAQQLFMFMLPAVIAAMLSTRLPAELLGIRRGPHWGMLALAMLTTAASMPAMNCIVEWCNALPWPQSIIDAEALNEQTVEMLIGTRTAPNLLLGLCVVALLPGLCEELFFRGALQNLLRSRPMNLHLAVWLTAIVFSLMHGQPMGFVPRMLLGAGFGYAAVWSGSLWTAIACHVLNNGIVVTMQWAGIDDQVIGLSTPALSALSALLTAAGLWLMWRNYSRFISRGI